MRSRWERHQLSTTFQVSHFSLVIQNHFFDVQESPCKTASTSTKVYFHFHNYRQTFHFPIILWRTSRPSSENGWDSATCAPLVPWFSCNHVSAEGILVRLKRSWVVILLKSAVMTSALNSVTSAPYDSPSFNVAYPSFHSFRYKSDAAASRKSS